MMGWVSIQCQNGEFEGSVEHEIRALWREYLIEILGIPSEQAHARIRAEIRGDLHLDLLTMLEDMGWSFSDATILDVGCGTGALALALIQKGAFVVGVEPSKTWAAAANRRLSESHHFYGQVLIGGGERIPLADNSVDYVMSLQVLEHVPMSIAQAMIREIARVLRPNGKAYLSFENYASFFEPHYRVGWFPYLPKLIGGIYLKLRRRNPYFLNQHIFYNSVITISQSCLNNGLVKTPWIVLKGKLEKPNLVKGFLRRQIGRVLFLLPEKFVNIIIIAYAERCQLLNTTFRLELTNG